MAIVWWQRLFWMSFLQSLLYWKKAGSSRLWMSPFRNWQMHAAKEGEENFTALLFEVEILFTDPVELVMEAMHLFGNNNDNSSIWGVNCNISTVGTGKQKWKYPVFVAQKPLSLIKKKTVAKKIASSTRKTSNKLKLFLFKVVQFLFHNVIIGLPFYPIRLFCLWSVYWPFCGWVKIELCVV